MPTVNESTLRVNLEVAGDGTAKASVVDVSKAIQGLDASVQKLGTVIAKLDQTYQGLGSSAKQAADATQPLADAQQQVGESAEEAAKRIKDMVAASAEAQRTQGGIAQSARWQAEQQREAAKATSELGAGAQSATSKLDALAKAQAQANERGARLNAADARRQAQQAAQGIDEERASLERLLRQIDPTVAAFERLDQQEAKLRQARASGVLSKDDYDTYKAKIDSTRDSIGKLGDASSHLGLTSAAAKREFGTLVAELARGDIGDAQRTLFTLANTTGLLRAALSPLGLGVGTVTAALAALGAGAYAVYQQQAQLNQAMAQSGNVAGVTSGQIDKLAVSLGGAKGKVGEARDILTGLVRSGQVGSEALAAVGQAAYDMAQLTKQSTEQATADALRLFDGTAASALKANEQYHFLSDATYQQIKALEEQGDKTGAARVAAEAYHSAVAPLLAEETTKVYGLAAAWQAVGKSIGSTATSVWDRLKQTGSLLLGTADIDTRIYNLQGRKATAQQGGGSAILNGLLGQGWSKDDEAKLQALIKLRDDMLQQAQDRATQGGLNQGAVEADAALDKLAAGVDKLAAKKAALADLAQQFDALWAGASPDNARLAGVQRIVGSDGSVSYSGGLYDKLRADIEKRYADNSGAAAARTDEAGEEAKLKQTLDRINGDYDNAMRVLDAQRKANLVGIEGYYTQQHDLLTTNEQQQVQAIDAEIARLQQRQATGAERERLENRIAALVAQRSKVESDAAAKDQANATAESDALKQRTRAIDEYQQSLERMLSTAQSQADQQVLGVGLGRDQNALQSRIYAIREQADQQAYQLTRDKGRGQIDQTQYDQELAALQSYQERRIQLELDTNARLRDARMDWHNGVISSLQDIQYAGQDIAGGVADTITGAFRDGTDAIINFATTGKLQLTDLANNFISNVLRMELQAAEAQAATGLLSWVGGMFGGGGGAGYTSLGGSASSYAGIGSSFGGGIDFASLSGGFAEGGRIVGPGTGTSDSILARVSNGENIVTARATEHYGQGFIDRINSMQLPRFASGGRVGGGGGGGAMGMPNFVLNITNTTGEPVQQSEPRLAGNGDVTIDMLIGKAAKQAKAEIAEEVRMGRGQTHAAIRDRFGLSTAGGL